MVWLIQWVWWYVYCILTEVKLIIGKGNTKAIVINVHMIIKINIYNIYFYVLLSILRTEHKKNQSKFR